MPSLLQGNGKRIDNSIASSRLDRRLGLLERSVKRLTVLLHAHVHLLMDHFEAHIHYFYVSRLCLGCCGTDCLYPDNLTLDKMKTIVGKSW